MAKVRRFSGQLKMELSFNDRSDSYSVKMCPVVRGEKCKTVKVGAPRHLTTAVDSPKAYDSAARAAIVFAPGWIQDYADYGSSGPTIRRPRRRKRRR